MLRVTAQEMRVSPLEAGLQEQVSNHPKLLWSRAMVVSVKEKSRHWLGLIARRQPYLFSRWSFSARPVAGR